MGIIGNRYLAGQPVLPYPNVKSYQGADIFLDVEFVDHTNTPVVPTSIKLEIDDLTNAQQMLGPTTLVIGGSTIAPLFYPAFAAAWNIQVSGPLVMQMMQPYQGSQICQLKFQFTAIDTVTGQTFTAPQIAIVELCSAATVSGTF